jgi:hypothetical protein
MLLTYLSVEMGAEAGSACRGITRLSGAAAFALATALNGEAGELLPWQNRNFLPLPQGQG